MQIQREGWTLHPLPAQGADRECSGRVKVDIVDFHTLDSENRRDELISALVGAVRRVTSAPLIVKLSPNVTDVTEFAAAAKDCGADAVSAVNTFLGMKIDVATGRPHFQNRVAGLSGPAIRPIAVRIVYEIFARVKIPIIGLGGISSAEDALEFLVVGARAVQIGTASFRNPQAACSLVKGIEDYLRAEGLDSVESLIGTYQEGV